MRFVVVARGKIRLVGGKKRQPARIGKFDQSGLGDPLSRQSVALQLDVEAIAQQPLPPPATGLHERALPGTDRPIERTVRPAAQCNQSLSFALKPCALDVRLLRLLGVEVGARTKAHPAAGPL